MMKRSIVPWMVPLLLLSLSVACGLSGDRPELSFSPEQMPAAQAGEPYSQVIAISENETPVFQVIVADGVLPPGLALEYEDGDTATITGIPDQAGTFAFTIEASCLGTNVSGQTGQKQYEVVVTGAASLPDDFSIHYRWNEGSLPPPYYYEYEILLSADGEGEVIMYPDYPSDATPEWRESFSVSEAELAALYASLLGNGLLTEDWRQTEDIPIGGSSQRMTVIAGGLEVSVPRHVISDQQEKAGAMYAAVKSLVPQEIWDRLDDLREQFIADHPDG